MKQSSMNSTTVSSTTASAPSSAPPSSSSKKDVKKENIKKTDFLSSLLGKVKGPSCTRCAYTRIHYMLHINRHVVIRHSQFASIQYAEYSKQIDSYTTQTL